MAAATTAGGVPHASAGKTRSRTGDTGHRSHHCKKTLHDLFLLLMCLLGT